LEDALECHGRLEVGKPDDFLTQYLMFYDTYKGSSPAKGRRTDDQLELGFDTKLVVFDFDGTLTKSSDSRTTWERLWVALGYPMERCFQLHRRFQHKEFGHQEWCNITRDAFKARNMSDQHIVDVAGKIELVDGAADAIESLHGRGVRLYILSGSIRSIIWHVLGDLRLRFEEIKANEIVFDTQTGIVRDIVGTPYDFEGKATFLKRIIDEHGLAPLEVLFVGNSCNDVFASQSGVRTLCVNATFTDPDNSEHWTYALREMSNLGEMLKFVY
jgi:phosphoserine phosphatase